MIRPIPCTVLILTACSRQELAPIPVVEKNAFLPAVRAKLEQAEKAARDRPRDAAASGELGMILHAHQLYLPAEICYRRAHTLAPDQFRWAYYLGLVQLAGKKPDAAQSLAGAVRLDPEYLPARLRLADALWDSGRRDEAEAAWRAAAGLDANNAAAQLGLGRVALAASRWAGAIEHLERAVSLFPRYGAAHYALSQAYAASGDTGRSQFHQKLYNQSAESAPDTEDPLLAAVGELHAGAFDPVARGVRLSAEGKFQEAAREFEAALRIDPRELAAHQNLIIVYGSLNRIADAESHYQKALEVNPRAAEAHFNWGVLMARTGRTTQAAGAFRKTVEAQPTHAEALTNLAVIEEEMGDSAAARTHYAAAIGSQPSHAAARFRLGRLLLSEGRAREAMVHLQEAARTPGPLEAQALYGLALAWKMVGQADQSLQVGRRALAKAV
ncbi:MAG: tetratricopeptide repeat protein, partial [Bryobacteraceae bacterium]|nr:tetratricopeptide repeat protein [Bryobacteraceae bacterium]